MAGDQLPAAGVPLAWFTAEQAAHDLIAGRMPTATFEYRATRDVLALTIFLLPWPPRNDHMRDCLGDGWQEWCQAKLAEHQECPDLHFAQATLRWLRQRLLGSGTLADKTLDTQLFRFSAQAHQIGLMHARRVLARSSLRHPRPTARDDH
jgi:hypothetical protein